MWIGLKLLFGREGWSGKYSEGQVHENYVVCSVIRIPGQNKLRAMDDSNASKHVLK